MPTSAEEFLFGSGQTAKFEKIGDRHVGIVLTDPVTRAQTDFASGQPKYWPSGEPMEQLVIRLLTQERDDADDDGVRVLYIDSKNKRESLRDAVRNAGAKKIHIGGLIDMAYSGDGQGQGGNPPKLYATQYAQPTQQTLAAIEAYKAGPAPTQQQTPWAPPGQFPTQNLPQQPQPQWGPPPQPAQGFPQQQPAATFNPQAALQGQPAWGTQAPVPPPAPPQQAQPVSWNAEIIAALKNAGADPKQVYPDYDGRFDQ